MFAWGKSKPKADARADLPGKSTAAQSAIAPDEAAAPPATQSPSAPPPFWPQQLGAETQPPQPKPKTTLEPITLKGKLHQLDGQSRSDSADQAAAAFGKIASVLMRNEQTGQYRLADLAWLVAPPVAAGTYAIIDATNAQTRATTPAAVALWALVSPSIDQRLSANLTEPIQLAPQEWQSGSIPWLITAAGESAALQRLMEHLIQTRFKGQSLKMRTLGPDGRAAIGVLTSA